MKRILLGFYCSLPFFICSLFAVLIKYTTRGGGMFDFSELIVCCSFVFFGTVLLIVNLLIFARLKNKQILTTTRIYQWGYLIAYTLLCGVAEVCIEPVLSYDLAFVMPFIIMAFVVVFNIVIGIILKSKNNGVWLDKASVIALAILLCIAVASISHYYVEWASCKEWAQMQEEIVIWDRVQKEEGHIDSFYEIRAVKASDEVYAVTFKEFYYYNTEEEGLKIEQYLRGKNTGKVSEDLFGKEGYTYSYSIEYSLGGWLKPKVTEASLHRINPIIKDVTVDGKVSYSKLEELLLNNQYSRE